MFHSFPFHVARLTFPKTQTVTFETVFKSIEDETKAELAKITESRSEVVVASERSYAEAGIKGLAKYLPMLFGCVSLVERLRS